MKLQIKNATVQYGTNTVLWGADFEIHDNEKIALVGRNGSGKTTLLKLITGELTMENPDSDENALFMVSGGVSIGMLRQISFEDGQISAEEEIKKVFAPVYACSDEMRKVEKALEESADAAVHDRLLSRYASLQKRFDALGGMDCEREMLIMFQQFGFSMEDLKKPMGTFSGGQQTKIAFMKLLLEKPDILLLDEPTNHLDLPAIEWLEGYLKNYRSAVVIVSHDRAFLDEIVSITYEIEYGRITRYTGNYSAFVKQKEDNFEKRLKDYEAQQKEIQRLTEWIEKWKNTPTKVSSVHSKEKVLERMPRLEKPRKFDTRSFRAAFDPRIESWSEVLKVKDLGIGYDRELSRVSFTLRKKEHLAVIGANGMGKSTFLKTIIGSIPSLSGSYEFGRNVEWGYFDQQQAVIEDADKEETILENFCNTYPKLTYEEARHALGSFVFSGEDVEKKLGQLSGGERVRLALCKVFFTRPNLLILDEPTNHMDMIGREVLEEMLSQFEGTVIVVSHDRYFISRVATCILDFTEYGCRYYEMGYEDYRSEKQKQDNKIGNVSQQSDVLNKTENREQAEKDRLLRQNPGKLESKLIRKIEKVNKQLDEAEAHISYLIRMIEDPGNATDYQKLMELQKQTEESRAEQDELLMELMETEDELEQLRQHSISAH